MATTTLLSQIVARCLAVAQASVPPAARAEVDRVDAESIAEAPLVNVLAKQVQREPHAAGFDKCEAEVELHMMVRADACTDAAEALHLALHGPLVVDAQLLQLVDSIRLTDEAFDRHEADSTSLKKTATYRCTYTLPKNSL